MPLRNTTRHRLLCPACRYDVATTLCDGFLICPECGGPISEEACRDIEESLPAHLRRRFYNRLTFVMIVPPVLAVIYMLGGRGIVWFPGMVQLALLIGFLACVFAAIDIERWLAGAERMTPAFQEVWQGFWVGAAGWFLCSGFGGMATLAVTTMIELLFR